MRIVDIGLFRFLSDICVKIGISHRCVSIQMEACKRVAHTDYSRVIHTLQISD